MPLLQEVDEVEELIDDVYTPDAPLAPRTLQETGLTLAFLTDLILKTFFNRGAMRGADMSRMIGLPFKIVDQGLTFLKDTKCIEISGGDMIGSASYRFQLTD